MSRSLSNILVTGGAGFIGSNFIRFLLSEPSFMGKIINVDVLTYAGKIENLIDVDNKYGKNCPNENSRRYFFEKADICDRTSIDEILKKYNIDTILNFAAETHVDRSILGPGIFLQTNIIGTYTLLEAAYTYWIDEKKFLRDDVLFHHVSTDEVYGSLGETGSFFETTAYDPRSPYSASKAASDHFVSAYFHTYGLPVTISNCSNNYGPYQFPEKLIPLMINNILDDKPLPVYGDGLNVRDWIYVEDHNRAVWQIMQKGKSGETYNIGGESEVENIRLLEMIINIVADETGKDINEIKKTITYVKDRPGHDRRYAIDCTKIKNELNWRQSVAIEEGLKETIKWYLDSRKFYNLNDEYKNWIETNYYVLDKKV